MTREELRKELPEFELMVDLSRLPRLLAYTADLFSAIFSFETLSCYFLHLGCLWP